MIKELKNKKLDAFQNTCANILIIKFFNLLMNLKFKLKNRKLIKINFRFEVVKFKIMKLFY